LFIKPILVGHYAFPCHDPPGQQSDGLVNFIPAQGVDLDDDGDQDEDEDNSLAVLKAMKPRDLGKFHVR
jgi:hypothetical protein